MSLRQNQITPVDARGVPRNEVPYWINIEPPAAVAAGGTTVVPEAIGPRDFVWTHVAFRSQEVGVPPVEQPFKVLMTDIGDSTIFGARRWNVRAAIGVNKDAFELPKPWRFRAKTTLQVEFENTGGLAAIPTLVLHGYLD